MEGHGIGFWNIGHEYNPYEESDENIDTPLKTLRVPLSDNAIIFIKHAPATSYLNT